MTSISSVMKRSAVSPMTAVDKYRPASKDHPDGEEAKQAESFGNGRRLQKKESLYTKHWEPTMKKGRIQKMMNEQVHVAALAGHPPACCMRHATN